VETGWYQNGNGAVLALYWHGICMVLAWRSFGRGVGMVLVGYCVEMVLIEYWLDIGMVLM